MRLPRNLGALAPVPAPARDGNAHTQCYAECVACGWLAVAATVEQAQSAATVHWLLQHRRGIRHC